jgi:hypothetical protein
VARHRSPRDRSAQPLPSAHPRGPGTGSARQPAVHVLLLGHAAVATTVAAGGTVAVAQGDPVPTMHENPLATSSAWRPADAQLSGVSASRRYCRIRAARPLALPAPMTLSSALARSMRSAGPRVGRVVVGVVVLVSALCHLGQILPSGSEHDGALSPPSVSTSADESWHAPAVGSKSDSGGEHSCQHERSTAAHPQAPAPTAVGKSAVFDRGPNPAADTCLPLVTDRPPLPGPRQHVLCVMRT